MKVADLDFYLPETLIAKKPSGKRDHSRLLVLHKDGRIEHTRFYNLPEYLNKRDMLILNNTRVFPARLTGIKPTGGKIEFLLIKEICPDTWEILSRKKYSGIITISENFSAEISEGRIARFSYSGDFMENVRRHGDMPLPPYIKRRPNPMDKEWYQTVYASNEGSIAAPTAGFHFTGDLIDQIKDKGVAVRYITLHVGIGTFKPVRTNRPEEHSMDSEYFEISSDIIKEIKAAKDSGRKIIAVGTTTTRAVEGNSSGQWSSASNGPIVPSGVRHNGVICGYTNIFIYPGYKFNVIDSLVTNFHLPHSTPLLLTSALCGPKNLMKAYNEAIAHKYRFFSYGDAMLIL
ncbi:MAG: tRNA preQ1(34) S-adenosylmethionine ribosyltransferase-isomerase QueA [Nitrospirae bacterium]|nr:tRNA preQ1(34) S-adenosylmethionine ribosyltransferase-isomerase QueA [Nitrospirota bacterium]